MKLARKGSDCNAGNPNGRLGSSGGATSVSRWRTLVRKRGDARPGALGGDRRSGRIEAQRSKISNVAFTVHPVYSSLILKM